MSDHVRFAIPCPFCDHTSEMESKDDGAFPASWAIKLHESAIAHLRVKHRLKRGERIGIHRVPSLWDDPYPEEQTA